MVELNSDNSIIRFRQELSEWIEKNGIQKVNNTSTESEIIAIWNLPRRNKNFVGRHELLNYIKKNMIFPSIAYDSPVNLIIIHAFNGIGGIGKTALSIEYAYCEISNYKLIWFIRSEDEESLKIDFSSLGKKIGAQTQDLKEDEIISSIKEHLRKFSPWLLIFDNADPSRQRMIEKYIPNGGGHIVITSRLSDWKNIDKKINVEVFQPKDAVECLFKISELPQNEKNEKDAHLLVESLKCLPLAIVQSAYYCKNVGCDFEEYKRLFNKYTAVMLDNNQELIDYEYSVKKSLSISFKHVYFKSIIAIKILGFCSFVNADNIPKNTIYNWLADELSNELPVNNGLEVLNKFSIITFSESREHFHYIA